MPRFSTLLFALGSFIVCLFIISQTGITGEIGLLYALIGMLILLAARYFVEYLLHQQEELRNAQAEAEALREEQAIEARETLRREERQRELERERLTRSHASPIYLWKLELIIEDNKGNLRRGRVVNPKTDRSIRPVAVFDLNELSAVGKSLAMEFNLVGPRKGIQFRYKTSPILQKGKNTVYSEHAQFLLKKNMLEGTYSIRLWAANREWGENTYVVSTDNLATAGSDLFGADLETKPGAEKIAEQILSVSSTSIDDLL